MGIPLFFLLSLAPLWLPPQLSPGSPSFVFTSRSCAPLLASPLASHRNSNHLPSLSPSPPPAITIALNKPKGILCTHDDELGRETVYDLLYKLLPPNLAKHRFHALGRLDADTTGLLILTTEPPLVAHATHPNSRLSKTYVALAAGQLSPESLQALRCGVELTGGLGMSAPCSVELVEVEGCKNSEVKITISEGKNRQVRRMLLAVGSQALRLHRESFGGVQIGDLEEGGWRVLGDDELKVRIHVCDDSLPVCSRQSDEGNHGVENTMHPSSPRHVKAALLAATP